MPEILTESFCERCGTRYTFESNAPKARRLGRFKTISRGLKNFVMSDDTSLDEALAAARSDEERDATAQQLDAFHKTFNFCMTCRQYTCANCWNEPEGRCLTCAPHLGHEVLPAPFPTLDPTARMTLDLAAAPETNGHAAPVYEEAAWPTADLPVEPAPEPWPLAAAQAAEPEPWPLPAEPAPEPWPLPAEPAPEPAVAAEAVAEPEPWPLAAEPAPAVAEPAAAPGSTHEQPRTVDERAATAAAQTAALLAKFRPGQSIDEALEEYEAAVAEAAIASEEAPEPSAPVAEIAPALAEAAAEAAPAPEPAAPAEDRVEQPAWQLVAPETPLRAADGHPAEPPAAPASQPPARAPEPPQWPSTPQWPQPAAASDSLAFLGARSNGTEDIWAASSRDLMAAAPTAGTAVGGVQSCVSCGLSLSATARFCRRCGTRQGG
jgi:ribosomal protein L40E